MYKSNYLLYTINELFSSLGMSMIPWQSRKYRSPGKSVGISTTWKVPERTGRSDEWKRKHTNLLSSLIVNFLYGNLLLRSNLFSVSKPYDIILTVCMAHCSLLLPKNELYYSWIIYKLIVSLCPWIAKKTVRKRK